MYVQIFVCLCCCVAIVTPRAAVSTENNRVRRQAADFKIAQYRACLSVQNFYKHDCRNIGWGLVDVLRSGRRKKAELPPFQLIIDETSDDNDDVDDSVTYL